jgi:PKD repeat protein
MITAKRLFISATTMLVMAGLCVPTAGYALTEDELREQIAELLLRVSELQDQMGSSDTSTTNTPTTNTTTSNPNTTTGSGALSSVLQGGLSLDRYLERGMSGADVAALQSFLRIDPSVYPEGQLSAFFGPLTERAVQRFQVKCGIVTVGDYQSTGYGRVGPMTRNALKNGCRTGTQPTGDIGGVLRVLPTNGPAPLLVTVEVVANTTRSCAAKEYLVDFGDGSPLRSVFVPANLCGEVQQSIPYTYQTPGTYVIKFGADGYLTRATVTVQGSGTVVVGGGNGNFNYCSVSAGSTIINTQPRQCRMADGTTYTDTSTGTTGPTFPTNNTLSVSPGSGNAPLPVVARFNIRPGDPFEIDWGDGSPVTSEGSFSTRTALPFSSTSFTQGFQERVFQHTYTTGGARTLTLKVGQYEQEGSQWVWRTRFYTRQVAVTGSVGSALDALSASPTSGTVPLTVTFNVTINGSASCNGGDYLLEFGDGQSVVLAYPADACRAQSFNVTHRYDSAGSLTAKLYSEQKGGGRSVVKTVSLSLSGTTTTTATSTVSNFAVIPGIDGNFRKVELRFTTSNCSAYNITWGDSTSTVGTPAAGCTGTQTNFTPQHTYSANGTYNITLTVGTTTQTASVAIAE